MRRSEVLFLYDVKWGNPNGDPLDENKPRMDEATSTLIVTDVRLKRTIRDYLQNACNETLWVTGEAVSPKNRLKELELKVPDKGEGKLEQLMRELYEKCIDVRLFGAVVPAVERGAMETSLTGPVQFRYGRSLHRVKWEFIQGTAAFLSKEGAEQRSFREEYVVPYVLIAFYGVVNDLAAKDTGLRDEDIGKMYKAMWFGTKNLITRSKMEQTPRLLLIVEYKDGVKFHHGELDYLVRVESEKDDFELRDVTDFKLQVGDLIDSLSTIKEKIEKIRFAVDKRLKTVCGQEEGSIENFLGKVVNDVEELKLE